MLVFARFSITGSPRSMRLSWPWSSSNFCREFACLSLRWLRRFNQLLPPQPIRLISHFLCYHCSFSGSTCLPNGFPRNCSRALIRTSPRRIQGKISPCRSRNRLYRKFLQEQKYTRIWQGLPPEQNGNRNAALGSVRTYYNLQSNLKAIDLTQSEQRLTY